MLRVNFTDNEGFLEGVYFEGVLEVVLDFGEELFFDEIFVGNYLVGIEFDSDIVPSFGFNIFVFFHLSNFFQR